jgi:DNA-binding NarL/FixJ family response regulator
MHVGLWVRYGTRTSWSVMNKELIRILIVDDHAVVREGLKHVISRQMDMIVAGEASTRAEALKFLDEQRFDVVVCDVKLPDGQGWDVLKAVKSGPNPLPVLMLSAFTEEQYAVQALKSGADGYVNKGSAAETLISAIRRLAAGGKFVSPEFAAHVAQVLGHGDPAAHEALSEREFAVMRMIASGNSLVSIAQNLNISPKTVTTYRARVLEKLGLENNAALTRYVLEKGLLE